GMVVAPQAMLLPGPGATQQLAVTGPDGSDLTAASSGAQYFTSNPAVLRVSADGVVTALAIGSATVTVSSGPAEGVGAVKVGAPQPGPVAAGGDGAVVQGSDGSVVVVPAGAVQQGTPVSITPLGPGDLTLPLAQPFQFAAAFHL